MNIIPASSEYLSLILPIYEKARFFMASYGNARQWAGGYPQRALLETDIEKKQLYLCMDDDRIAAVFMFFIGEDPNYGRIEDGRWPDERPYGTIHRLASAGIVRGAADFCIAWCFARCLKAGAVLRGDTHEKNMPMRHVFEKNEFQRCGIVYMADGTPRIAYQKGPGNHEACHDHRR